MLSVFNWLTLSGAEQSGLRGPSTENQEAKQAAVHCIKVLDSPQSLNTVQTPSAISFISNTVQVKAYRSNNDTEPMLRVIRLLVVTVIGA